MISIQNPDANLEGLRPATIPEEHHLVLLFKDRDEVDHERSPQRHHVETLVSWLKGLDRADLSGLLVHCDAGVSRSTACAWLALVVLEPAGSADEHLKRVEHCAGSAYCWPNPAIAELGDEVLGSGSELSESLARWKAAQNDRKW